MNQPGSGVAQVLEAGSKMETPPLNLQRSRRPLRARLARWGVMLVIFIAGGVAGYSVGTVRSLDSDTPTRGFRPEQFTEYLLAKLQKDLVLSDAQTPKVKDILVRRHKKFDDLRKQTQPLFEKAMSELDREMQAVLTPSQWELYKERRASRHRRPPPGSSGRSGSGRGDGHRDDHGPGRGGWPPHDGKGPSYGPKSGERPKPDAPASESPAKVEPPQVEPVVEKAAEAK